jgi:hypothetical protein
MAVAAQIPVQRSDQMSAFVRNGVQPVIGPKGKKPTRLHIGIARQRAEEKAATISTGFAAAKHPAKRISILVMTQADQTNYCWRQAGTRLQQRSTLS